MIRPRALPIIGVLALAACADIPVQPSAPESLRRSDASLLAAQADGPGTYILSFKNERIPRDVEATVAQHGGRILYRHAPTGLVIVGGLATEGLSVLSAHKELDAMDANAIIKVERPTRVFAKKRDQVDPTQAILYGEQWYLDAVGAPAAWNHEQFGSRRVDIGIVDTGIDYLNVEFDGLIDIQRSQVFSDLFPVEPAPSGALSFADLNGHGTIVANVAVSKAVWTAGVTTKTGLVALKACNVAGDCDLGITLAAVLYGADAGLDVLNISSGGIAERRGRKVKPGPPLIRIVEKVFRYAHRRGVTVVVSAGNETRNLDSKIHLDDDEDLDKIYNLYCDVPNVICVSATGPSFVTTEVIGDDIFVDELKNIDTPAFYTNYGRRVDVAAPGGNIAAVDIGGFAVIPVLGACSGFIPGFNCGAVPVFATMGTSVAAPHVSALAALLANNPRFSREPSRIASRIFRTATDCGAPGKDVFCGHGQINIAKALRLENDN